MFANNQNGCMSLGLMDVCNTIVGTATVPIPYVNIATSTTAIPNAVTVFVGGGIAHNLLTSETITSGDELEPRSAWPRAPWSVRVRT